MTLRSGCKFELTCSKSGDFAKRGEVGRRCVVGVY